MFILVSLHKKIIFYVAIVQGLASTAHFMGCVQWFKHIKLWILLSGLQLCLFLFKWSGFPFKWHLSASESRPTGMASGWRTAGAGEPAVRWALQAPTAETRDRGAPPFLRTKATREQGWHVDQKREGKKKKRTSEQRVKLISQDAVQLLDILTGLDQFADILSI